MEGNTSNALEVSLLYSPVINLAMQQNHAPVLRELILRNNGLSTLEDVDVRLSFEPEFAVEKVLHISRIAPGCEETLTDIPLMLSTGFLANLTERVLGAISLLATSKGESLCEERYEISVLTYNEWGGNSVMPEMLSAFCLPNHPECARVVKRASDILGKWTGSPSLDEYQTRDPNRVKYQMAAIFEAIAQEQIAYCTPPASFESAGQRIRLPDEILSNKLATCLDMTMLYAGCLEAIGLHPLVIITKGHAFAGCWLVRDTFPDCVNDDPSLLTKRIAGGINEVLAVETTCMNAGSKASFDDACLSAQRRLNSDEFILFVDIIRARISQIRPLPLRVAGAQGYSIVEDSALGRDFKAPEDLSSTDIIIDSKGEVSKKTIWERKLLDLSLRNNLLNTRLTRDTVPIISVHINELEDALAADQDFNICPKPLDWDNDQISAGIYRTVNANDPIYQLLKQELSHNRIRTYLDEEGLKKSLTHLYRSSRTAMEENGANTLYLALGLLKWFETPGSKKPRYAPILLIPVEMVRRSASSGYIIRSRDEETMLNITLLELLRQAFSITIGGLDPLPRDEIGVDVNLIFNTIRRKIMDQTGWDVVEQAILGNFSFNKFIMWNDIHNNSDVLCRNRTVSSLMTGVVDSSINEEIGGTEDIDGEIKPGDVVLPISADSSQLEAICAALSGKSFILHGPPGTGKSQTITNIIANALYRGKRVLFVAEKMAALEVVQHRLESIGLGPFCLELHSNKAKKSSVLEQLKRTTEVAKRKPCEDYAAEARQIAAVRGEMNGYVDTMHKAYPVGISLFDCIARYCSIGQDIPAVSLPVSAMGSVSSEQVTSLEIALSEYKAACSIVGDPSSSPLQGIGLTEYTPETEAAFDGLAALAQDCRDLAEVSRRVFSSLFGFDRGEGFTYPELEALGALVESTRLSAGTIPEVMSITEDGPLAEIEEACRHGLARDAASREILKDYDDSLLSVDASSLEQEWRTALTKGFLSKLSAQNKVRKRLQTYSRAGKKPGKEEILPLVKSLSLYQKEDGAAGALQSSIPVLSSLSRRGAVDWALIDRSCSRLREIWKTVSGLSDEVSSSRRMRSGIAAVQARGVGPFLESIGGLFSEFERLVSLVGEGVFSAEDKLKASFGVLPDADWALETERKCRLWISSRGKLRSWIMYNQRKSAIASLGFPEIAGQVESGAVPYGSVIESFHKGFYKSYAEYILTLEPGLNLFHGEMFEEKIARFRGLCKDFETLTREEVFATLASNLPALQKEASQGSEVGILQRNIRNGCRGTSLRKFFDQIPDLLSRMCPCMLMSPISVAQYIDAEGPKFDLVIFDEASQMPTCEAVGAIARGNSIIVVGDPKQMPPTNFFSTSTYDEDNPDLEDLESILDDCLALSFPSKYLRWHYRSKHESLIAFSNCKFYDNSLLTFPSPDDLETKLLYQHVEGVYDRGGNRQNRAEAVAVIDEIRRRLEDPVLSRRSIGVVTFNTNQQSLIEDLLTDLFAANPELEKTAMACEEHIFVKNLENVQGDERDVILFSVGYGQDKNGKIALNFGPLNREGGWRRLNVAVSRARYEMKVFSTLVSDQIDLKRTSAEGVAGLKAFLEYAEKGRAALRYNSAASSVTVDGFVEAVAAEIRRSGYEVRTNVGCSGYRVDIGVVDPGKPSDYVLGILCDGYNYSSSRSARDREIVQIGVLRKLGWNICRVWAMDWWNSRDDVVEKLLRSVQAAIAGEFVTEEEAPLRLYNSSLGAAGGGASGSAGGGQLSGSAAGGQLSGLAQFSAGAGARPGAGGQGPRRGNGILAPKWTVITYVNAKLEEKAVSSENLSSSYYSTILRRNVRKLIEVEAPIRQNLLCKKVLRAFGISRMGPRVSEYLASELSGLSLKTTGTDIPTYWRQDQDPLTYDKIRVSNEREALDIPPEEARNAALLVLEEQGALPVPDLVREMAKLFGYSRVGDNVSLSMTRGIDMALAKGLAEKANGRIKKSKSLC